MSHGPGWCGRAFLKSVSELAQNCASGMPGMTETASSAAVNGIRGGSFGWVLAAEGCFGFLAIPAGAARCARATTIPGGLDAVAAGPLRPGAGAGAGAAARSAHDDTRNSAESRPAAVQTVHRLCMVMADKGPEISASFGPCFDPGQ